MSGGHFNYEQQRILTIADEIQELIESGEVKDSVLYKFQDAVNALRTAYVYAKEIDWYLSGDTGGEELNENIDIYLKGLKQKGDGGR